MKEERGITLVSLTVYIIVMTIVIGVTAFISTYFYKNVDTVTDKLNPLEEYTKFNSYFSDEVNHAGIQVLECKDNYVIFDNGMQYMYVSENKAIYRNQVKICKEVTKASFTHKINNAKEIIEVSITLGDEPARIIEYTLKK